jgi:chaperonin GroEL
MKKTIKFHSEAREGIKKGIDTLANAVKVTMGPGGRNVVIDKEYGAPVITKDGVSVAKEIELKDPTENLGARLIKEVASKTADVAGDGTTTATVLAQSIITAGMKAVTAGANPIELKRGMDKAVKEIVFELQKAKQEIGNDNDKIKQIATVSANNDSSIGGIIADAMGQVGNDGVITVEESRNTETEIKIVEGMQFDRGYVSPYFATNDKAEAELKDPYILLCDKKIVSLKELLPILEQVSQKNKSLFIIAEGVDGEALGTLVVNKLRGNLSVAAATMPGFGDMKKQFLDDMAALTGATVISSIKGMSLDKATTAMLGSADKVVVGKDKSTVITGHGTQEAIQERIDNIKRMIDESTSDWEKEQLHTRLAKLIGGVAILRVGAASEVEMKEKKDRIDDALHATRAAVEEGIVPGGGVALVRASKVLDNLVVENEDQTMGVNIIKKAVLAPFSIIVSNAGLNPEVILSKIIDEGDSIGFDARNEVVGDMVQMGIIDPVKVTRVALENAASVASLVLTTECILVSEEDTSKESE